MEEDPLLPSTSQSGDFHLGSDESRSLWQPPASSKKRYRVGASLENLGNTCFLNVILQCITHTVPLVQKLRSSNHAIPCSGDEEFCTFCALRDHVNEAINKSGSVLIPERFRDNLRKISPDFEPGQQEDAHEFLRCLLNSLHNCSLDPISNNQLFYLEQDSIVKQVFGGRLRSQLRCVECGHCSDTYEPFLDLSLEIDDIDTVDDALMSFTKVEKIDDPETKFTCDGCQSQVLMEKQLKLDKAPDVLALQLKRFKNDGVSIYKIYKPVEYPSELDLKPFLSSPHEEVPLNYDLYGVVEHRGSFNFGHYVCVIRSSATEWHQLNDRQVASISKNNALNQQAYILFYIKRGLTPWFSSLLDLKELSSSPTSVLERTDREPSTSFGEGEGSCSTETPEKDECSPCTSTSVPAEAERCHVAAYSRVTDAPQDKDADKIDAGKPLKQPAGESVSDQLVTVVFQSEQLEDEEDNLIPQVQGRPEGSVGRPAPPAINLDKALKRLLRSVHGSRRRRILDCLAKQDEEQCRRSLNSRCNPNGKRRRQIDCLCPNTDHCAPSMQGAAQPANASTSCLTLSPRSLMFSDDSEPDFEFGSKMTN
ncbi:ubiquitin carboxyl-terminal hydrolase 21-like isoform X1 [Typha latifolia]|uniref:ubiquitin carboxyl-terminal hydrolase 21-like isoform X1 n=1 Tax=Typha latifolia TaxID=4733 RepID=UPI003C2D277F